MYFVFQQNITKQSIPSFEFQPLVLLDAVAQSTKSSRMQGTVSMLDLMTCTFLCQSQEAFTAFTHTVTDQVINKKYKLR